MERFPWQKALGLLFILVMVSLLLDNLSGGNRSPSPQVSYTLFKEELRRGNVKQVTLTEQAVDGEFLTDVAVSGTGQKTRTTWRKPPSRQASTNQKSATVKPT